MIRRRGLRLIGALVVICFVLTACQAGTQLPTPPAGSLPLPARADEAALVNFRPLTQTGLALGAVWSPQGGTLAYTTLSVAPNLVSFRDSNAQPKTQVWVSSDDGADGRMLDIGTVLFYNRDGSELYYQIYDAADNTPSVYAIDPLTQKTRHFLGTQGFPNVMLLADGRLVLSEVGTYAPLRVLDVESGEREALMNEHPSTTPQNARLSPDGKRLAYTTTRAVYLSRPNGASPKLLSDNGGGSARVWWSPDSKYLVYTTGATQTDKLILADRQGKTRNILALMLRTIGYISSVEWSPDSRWMLVSVESLVEYSRPTQLHLFDLDGSSQILLESYMAAAPAWSPDGTTLALSFWSGPLPEQPVFDIWLAQLTDVKTAAALPASQLPALVPTPTMPVISPSLTAEQVLADFWGKVNEKDFYTAWSMLSKTRRIEQRYPHFKAFYECMQQVSVTSIEPVQTEDLLQVFAVKIDYQRDADCNVAWQQENEFYATLSRAAPASAWQITCFNQTPDCIVPSP